MELLCGGETAELMTSAISRYCETSVTKVLTTAEESMGGGVTCIEAASKGWAVGLTWQQAVLPP